MRHRAPGASSAPARAGIALASVIACVAGGSAVVVATAAFAAAPAAIAPRSPVTTTESYRDCPECPEMVRIPAGRFVMGVARGEEERENLSEEFRYRSEPRREVTVRSFSIGKYEVTRGQYGRFAAETGRGIAGCFFWNGEEYQMHLARSWRDTGYAQDDDHPATCVSWEGATAYVAWLSRKTGKRYRLPTEAEWEYAARAGTATSRFWGDDGHAACAYANGADLRALREIPVAINWPVANCNDGHAYTAPVGSYHPNAYGLHDMLGNAAEWTQDCWNPNYSDTPTDGRAAATGECFLRVVRGGAWDESPAGLRAAYRVGSPVVIRVYARGFRVARDD